MEARSAEDESKHCIQLDRVRTHLSPALLARHGKDLLTDSGIHELQRDLNSLLAFVLSAGGGGGGGLEDSPAKLGPKRKDSRSSIDMGRRAPEGGRRGGSGGVVNSS